jgi:hypothetical protein
MISQHGSRDDESIKSTSSKNDHNFSAAKDKKIANMAAYPSTKDDDLEQAIIVESERTEADDPLPDNDTLTEDAEPTPPPDGGATAWTQCLCAHLTNITTFGFVIPIPFTSLSNSNKTLHSYITSYGSFQTHYESTLLTASGTPVPPSTIAWIGSVQLFLAFLIGSYSGRALDSGHFRLIHALGSALHVLGIFSTAQCGTVWWQVFLAQALCTGIAHGLMYCPAMALVTTYFAKRRALAVGLAALGSCTGGVVFPVLMRELLPRIGFAWTVRIIGFVVLGCDVLAGVLFRVRLEPRRLAPWVDWRAFRETPYVLFCAGMFCNFWVSGLALMRWIWFFADGFHVGAVLHVLLCWQLCEKRPRRQLRRLCQPTPHRKSTQLTEGISLTPSLAHVYSTGRRRRLHLPPPAQLHRRQTRHSQRANPLRLSLRHYDVRLDRRDQSSEPFCLRGNLRLWECWDPGALAGGI